MLTRHGNQDRRDLYCWRTGEEPGEVCHELSWTRIFWDTGAYLDLAAVAANKVKIRE